jgi:energy-coupling factor transporter ATP-binding protein EcfA2
MNPPRSGGPGMHYGLLFQIFSSLDRALTVSVQDSRQELGSIVLVVEPHGGDLIEIGPKQRDVYQYKARSNRRAWSLNEVIDKVLPDLFQAVPEATETGIETRYWLVTEGGQGTWDVARAFFKRLSATSPSCLLESLDDESYEFVPGRRQTEREFFLEVARRTTKGRHDVLEADTLRRMHQLLSNFEVKTTEFLAVQEKVTTLLLGFVEHVEKLQHTIATLIGVLVRWGREGNRKFTADELLRAGGLPPTSLALLSFLGPRIRERLDAQLAKTTYKRSTHVERPIVWPREQNVLCIVGESGSGKTSLLGQVAEAAAENGAVVFWSPRRYVLDPLVDAADEVWRHILRHDQSLHFDAIARRAEALKLGASDTWLTVCLDLTADAAYSAELVSHPWKAWRIRLAFTADATAAIHVTGSKPEEIVVLPVGEFTPRQIREFFNLRKIDWRRIPNFVIEPLRRHPILAYVYAELGEIATWRDTNEYALFRQFWDRITTAPGQHPDDTAALSRLADTLLETPDTLQWSATQLNQLKIDSATRMRLQRLGWLRNDSDDRAEFTHQRLTNWAVAEAIVDRFRNGHWTSQQVGACLEAMLSRRDEVHRRFSFVPMDALSIALASEIGPDEVSTILEAMENHQFYETLVPSLGAAVVPALLSRLRRIESRRHAPNGSVHATILAIAAAEPLQPGLALQMLNDEHSSVQRAGAELLTEHPVGEALDTLWRLRREFRELGSDDTLINHLDLEAVDHALEACVRVQPQWLARKLQRRPQNDEIGRLASLVATLANESGVTIWHDSKDLILAAVDDDGIACSAARCFGRYRDSDEVSRLVRWIEERVADVAEESFSALALVDPWRALQILKDSPRISDIAHHWNPWWSRLIAYDSAEMDKIAAEKLRNGEFLFRRMRVDDHACSRLAPAIIERVDFLILKDPTGDDTAVCDEIDHLVRFLARAYGLAALRFLETLSDSGIGQRLASYSAKRAMTSNIQPDDFIEDAGTVLLRIGGRPLDTFLMAQVARRDDGWFPHKIRAFQAAPSPEAERVVRHILDEVWDVESGDHDWPVRSACIETLAAMGNREVVMRAEESGRLSFSNGFPKAIRDLPPASDEETSRLLQNAADDQHAFRALRTLAWSHRTDVIEPIVDVVLSARAEEIRNAARTALDYLPTGQMSQSYRQRLRVAGEHSTYLDTLFRDGGADALAEAADYLVTIGRERWTPDDAHCAAWFVVYRQDVNIAEQVWQWTKASSRFYWESDDTIWRAIGRVEREEAEEFLVAEAYSGRRGNINPAAIEALAYRHQDEAFIAAVHLFHEGQSGRASAPDLLLEIDRARAIDVITERLIQERNVLIRTNSCVALRSCGDDIRRIAEDWTHNADPLTRASGCELLGWLPQFDTAHIRTLALSDIDPMVQVFALDALMLQESQEVTAELLAALEAANGTAAWALADALVTSAHPFLLDRFDDPLALYPALRRKPGALRMHAGKRLKKRVEEVQKKHDQPMRRDFYRR